MWGDESVLRIANCSGFYGDRFSAAREMVFGGDIDVLTGDYLAELTMFLLWKARSSGRPGYASTFLRQMEEVLGTCLDRGIKVVTNAGGLDPQALAVDLGALAQRLQLNPSIAYVVGDDVMPRLDEMRLEGVDFANTDTGEVLDERVHRPVTANAYLGGRGIATALEFGADIVVCPRVTDASLVVGPCMWFFGWREAEYDKIAGAVAAGHVIECGAQATGGNYAFFREVDQTDLPGFPIAEMAADGSAVITKHENTAGLVSVGTVTAQLVYEVGGNEYLNPDVVLHLDSLELEQVGTNRVRMSAARGAAPTPTLKVAMTCEGPYRQSLTFAVPGEDLDLKAEWARRGMLTTLGGVEQFDDVDFRLVPIGRDEAENELSVAKLIATFTSRDPKALGRRIFDAAMGLALSTYPGVYFQDERQQRPTQAGVNWPCLVPARLVTECVMHSDGSVTRIQVREPDRGSMLIDRPRVTTREARSWGAPVTTTLGAVFGARSGDKGANANVGIWGRTEAAYTWLEEKLTVDAFRSVFAEGEDYLITRTCLPNLKAVNFVVHGLLGSGAAAGARFDPQAKGLAEYVRSRRIELPAELVTSAGLGFTAAAS
jgi:hypothetical protein